METPVVLGLDFGGSKIAVAVADADGTRLAGDELAVRAADPATETLARGIRSAQALARAVTPGRPVGAVGASTFGIPYDDHVELAPNVPGWEGLPFGQSLALAFPGAAIRTATDVKAAAQAELDSGALAGCDPGLYVNLGTGLAVALTVAGTVLTGRHGAAGEIGYNLRRPGDGAVAERLEETVSGKALGEAASRLLGRPDVAALLARADADAVAVRQRFLDELGFHLVNLAVALDPQRIVVGGGLVRSWEWIGPSLRAALDAAVPFPPDLVVAAYPFEAPLLGALALGTAALRNHPTRDVISEGAPT
jgi:predicted NBD/HSP70 family sugar kinase